MDFYEKAAAVAVFCRMFSLSLDWATGTPVFRMWSTRKKKKVRGVERERNLLSEG